MGRAPCCENMGMKKGPWTPQEDQILVSYVQTFGHGNWRALPKQAGLLRCGKSCRLRWMNYLRPDIKRGNFTKEEEEIIIKLHQVLGNRWSTIAAKLPGRTDNEIKNVWHTHLKKRLHHNTSNSITHHQYDYKCVQHEYLSDSIDVSKKESESENASNSSMSRQYRTITDLSTTMVSSDNYYVPELTSEDFWTQVLSSNVTSLMPIEGGFELSSLYPVNRASDYDAAATTHALGDGDERDFWCSFMSKVGEFPELLEM